MIRFLTDKKKNNYNLAHWEQLTSSKAYKELYQNITDTSEIYEKEYLEQIKTIDIKDVRSVNKQFPDLSHHNVLPEKFYYSLQDFLVLLLR